MLFQNVGGSVFSGAFSTILAILLLTTMINPTPLSREFAFRLILMCVVGLFNSLILLPVVMYMIAPWIAEIKSVDDIQPQDDKNNGSLIEMPKNERSFL